MLNLEYLDVYKIGRYESMPIMEFAQFVRNCVNLNLQRDLAKILDWRARTEIRSTNPADLPNALIIHRILREVRHRDNAILNRQDDE